MHGMPKGMSKLTAASADGLPELQSENSKLFKRSSKFDTNSAVAMLSSRVTNIDDTIIKEVCITN